MVKEIGQNGIGKRYKSYCVAKVPLLARNIASLATQYSLFWHAIWAELQIRFCWIFQRIDYQSIMFIPRVTCVIGFRVNRVGWVTF